MFFWCLVFGVWIWVWVAVCVCVCVCELGGMLDWLWKRSLNGCA